jgi:hypothetical protein
MEDQPGLTRRISRELLKILLGVVIGLAMLAGLAYGVPAGMNWNAEQKARAFCDGVKRGADVAAMAANFDKSAGEQHILHYEADDASSHTFLFEGFIFDKAACRVVMDKDHKAVSIQVIGTK